MILDLSDVSLFVDRLQAVGRQPRPRRGRIAIAWVLRHPVVTGAIVGARTAKQVEGVMRAADLRSATPRSARSDQTQLNSVDDDWSKIAMFSARKRKNASRSSEYNWNVSDLLDAQLSGAQGGKPQEEKCGEAVDPRSTPSG